MRDGTSIGRAAGTLLADALLQIIDGTHARRPMGASRVGAELRRVVFDDHADAGAWLQTPGLIDAVVIDVQEASGELRILVPAEAATSFDIVWRMRFTLDGGALLTSEPAFVVAQGMDELLDDFNDGLAAGLELHPRTAEIRDGFGALGPFEG